MSRTLIAVFVAPLWAPLATFLVGAASGFHSTLAMTIIAGVFAYAGMIGFGLPALLLLRALDLTAFWIALLLGFSIGALSWLLFKVLFVLALGSSLYFAWEQAINLNDIYVGSSGLLGVLVGATFWVIARPDRFA